MPTRRERERREERYRDAKLPHDPPLTYRPVWLNPILDLPIGSRVVLYGRVSSRDQNVNVQCRALVNWVKKLGFIAITLHKEVFSGKTVAGRNALLKAIKRAQVEHSSLVVVGHTRLLRHPLFDKRGNCQITPTKEQWDELHKLLGGVSVYTLNSPTASNSEEEQFLKKLSSEVSNRGRPVKHLGARKRVKARQLAIALRQEGKTLAVIAKTLSEQLGFKTTLKTISIWTR